LSLLLPNDTNEEESITPLQIGCNISKHCHKNTLLWYKSGARGHNGSATNLYGYTKGKDKPRTNESKVHGCSAVVEIKADSGSGSQKSLPFVAVNMLKAIQHPLRTHLRCI
jgi:hypothetical protein